MQLKEINRDKIIERKRRLERHKKAIEEDTKEVTTQEKTVNDNVTIKDNIVTKKKAIKKRVIDKKAIKERHKAVAEKVMDDILKGNISIEKNYPEEEKEPKVVITKEERAERFKRLHAIAQDMMNKWNG